MISNCQKTTTTQQKQTKQRQLNSCLLKSINNKSSNLDSKTSHPTPIESTMSTMSTLAADLRTAAVAAATGQKKSGVKPPMEAVVVNSIIYSKPSFCRIAVDLGDVSGDKKPSTKLTNGSCPNNYLNSGAFCSSAMGLKDAALNINAATCLADLAASSSLNVGEDTKVYRMCTTINGSIHHQISDLCDNLLAMAGFFGVTNNEHDDIDDSFIEFAYRDDDCDGKNDEEEVDDDNDDEDDDDVDDDNEEDYVDGEDDDDDYYDEDLDDDDNDVVDFSYECPILPAPKLNCDKKKKVRFNTKPTVHVMHTWNYAYRAARKGEWEMYARDRERFKLRIQRAASTLNPILEREHRQKIYEKRFANLYDNDDYNDVNQAELAQTEADQKTVSQELKETSNNIESKKPHQKKKRRKKRFCKMGNKHYF
ncbi:hypothetical protein FF38_12907 [Lucilia cuprina]|uniref:Protein DP71L n=1 Tax=Lucilia cuprina TaxID=7375 RepID=A0A0L0BQF9_LUCCU|nr:hypothetical protein FF38_12907 [Lucilia cuprina]